MDACFECMQTSSQSSWRFTILSFFIHPATRHPGYVLWDDSKLFFALSLDKRKYGNWNSSKKKKLPNYSDGWLKVKVHHHLQSPCKICSDDDYLKALSVYNEDSSHMAIIIKTLRPNIYGRSTVSALRNENFQCGVSSYMVIVEDGLRFPLGLSPRCTSRMLSPDLYTWMPIDPYG
jgi:hypothetical protein